MDVARPRSAGPARVDARTRSTRSAALAKRWHGAADGRLRYAYAPRFVLSCTDELLREVGDAGQGGAGCGVHTHASENSRRGRARPRSGSASRTFTCSTTLGLLGPHVVHRARRPRLSRRARAARRSRRTRVHVPVVELEARVGHLPGAGIDRGRRRDGARRRRRAVQQQPRRLARAAARRAACTSRVAARARCRRPRSCAWRRAGGAAALGLGDSLGALEVGKRGDVIAVDVQALHTLPAASPWSQIAYAAQSCDVKHVVVDGRIVVRDRRAAHPRRRGRPERRTPRRCSAILGGMKLALAFAALCLSAGVARADAAADIDKFNKWFDGFADLAVADQNNCPKMGKDLNKSLDDNKAIVDAATRADGQRRRRSRRCGAAHDGYQQAAIRRGQS